MEDTSHIYPLKLTFVPKSTLWGGETLKSAYGKPSDLSPLSETWELSVREKENSMIENGTAAGMLLGDYLADYGRDLLGTRAPDGRFPLLVKFIDAADTLSVQVHPDDEYAARVEHDCGKTEMWVVLEAKEGAALIYGLADGADAEALAAAVREGRTESALCRVSVKPGDVFFIPAGMPHAIGAGILLAEIQQNSDLTYRLYDYDRVGADGKKRELHIEKAIAVSRYFDEAAVNAVRFFRAVEDAEGFETLAACPYFRVCRCETDGKLPLTVTPDSFVHLLCTEGEGEIVHEREAYPFKKGDSFFLPAALGECLIRGKATLLLSSL